MATRFRYIVAAVAAAGAASAAQATSTSAHAMVVSGHAGHYPGPEFACATSGPQPMEQKYFGSASNGLPTEGYAYCGLAGGIQDTSSANGISTANESVSHSFNMGLHTQDSTATADFGVLKAASKGSYTGYFDGGFDYAEGEAAAYSTDTIPVPLGAATVQLGLSIDGKASVAGNGQVLTVLDYQIDGGVIYGAFNLSLYSTSAFLTGLNGTSSGDVAGFTVAPGSISGTGTVTTFVSAVSGSTFDLTLALLTAAYPGPGGGVVADDFSDTSRVSSVSFFDAAGKSIAFGTLTGASGRLYDADGVHTAPVSGTPEPASWAMLLIGFTALGGMQRRTRRVAC